MFWRMDIIKGTLIVSLCLLVSLRCFTFASSSVNVGIIFNDDGVISEFSDSFYGSLNSVQEILQTKGLNVTIQGFNLSLESSPESLMKNMCNLEDNRSNKLFGIISTSVDPLLSYLGYYTGVPIISLGTDYIAEKFLGKGNTSATTFRMERPAVFEIHVMKEVLEFHDWWDFILLTNSFQKSKFLYEFYRKNQTSLLKLKQTIEFDPRNMDGLMGYEQLLDPLRLLCEAVIVFQGELSELIYVFKAAKSLKLNSNLIWIIGEKVFTTDGQLLKVFPRNVVAVSRASYGRHMQQNLMWDTVHFIGKVIENMLLDNKDLSGQPRSCWDDIPRNVSELLSQKCAYIRGTSFTGRTGYIRFNEYGDIVRPRYSVITLNRDSRWPKNPEWITSGIWENYNIGVLPNFRRKASHWQHVHERKFRIKVATHISKPFVDIFNTNHERKNCTSGHICLLPNSSDPIVIHKQFNQYSKEIQNGAKQHSMLVGCCHGLCIDLLSRISKDMNFDFDLYVVIGNASGEYSPRLKRWTGLTGDLISGAADMAVAPMMINSQRSEVIDFSLAYLNTPLSILMARNEQYVSIGSFMEPLDWSMWLGIFITLQITALAATFYEWHSPYGLTPNGRDRAKVFSLPSALNLCWSILFSHTVPTKTPKCWSSRFLLNVWACFSLVFLASYTANLAAFMVGDKMTNRLTGIHDYRITAHGYRCATVRGSDAELFMKKSFSRLYRRMDKAMLKKEISPDNRRVRPPLTTGRLIKLLRDGHIDLLILDRVILEYYVHTMQQSSLEFVGKGFGNLAYGIGLQKQSPFTSEVSLLIRNYEKEGYLENLYKLWFERMVGYKKVNNQKSIQLNTLTFSGVFLLFAVGILIGCVTLTCEIIVYKCFVPKIRASKKTRWILPYTQRLYRTVRAIPKCKSTIYPDQLKFQEPLLSSTPSWRFPRQEARIGSLKPYDISNILKTKVRDEKIFKQLEKYDIKNNLQIQRSKTCNIAVQTNIEERVETQLKRVDDSIERRLKHFEDDLRSMREQLAQALREKEELLRKVSLLESKPRHVIEAEIKQDITNRVYRRSPCKVSSKSKLELKPNKTATGQAATGQCVTASNPLTVVYSTPVLTKKQNVDIQPKYAETHC